MTHIEETITAVAPLKRLLRSKQRETRAENSVIITTVGIGFVKQGLLR